MALRKFLVLRKLRSSCLEGCGALIQPTDNFPTSCCAGVKKETNFRTTTLARIPLEGHYARNETSWERYLGG